MNVINLIKTNDIVNEIIIVDNLSNDKTAEIARSVGIVVISYNIQGKGYAMEEGLKFAKN